MNSGFKTFSLTALVILSIHIWTLSQHAAADEINILVPAYANPCCDGGPTMWSQLITSAGDPNRNYGLHVIFNPANGPGTARDGNYLDETGSGPLASIRTAGAKVHGYVATGFGTRDIDAIKSDIDQYLDNALLYDGFVDGIFFDEMSNDLANVGFYQAIADHVDLRALGAQTFANPGTSFVNNPSGQTDYLSSDYANVFDSLMTFENTGDQYVNNYTPPVFLDDKPASGFVHAIHTQADWDPSLLTLASDRKAGYLYVTDDIFLDPSSDNPWDSLTGDWSQFTSDVSNFNSVPEPHTIFGLLLFGMVVGLKRRRV